MHIIVMEDFGLVWFGLKLQLIFIKWLPWRGSYTMALILIFNGSLIQM